MFGTRKKCLTAAAVLVIALDSQHTSKAILPFNREVQLPNILVERLLEVGQHDLNDVEFVEAKLEINTLSPFAHFHLNGQDVDAKNFFEGSRDIKNHEWLHTNGDALPLRTGKFWNLQFEYILHEKQRFSGVKSSTLINIFDVEEYACVSYSNIESHFVGQKPTSIGDRNFQFRSYRIKYADQEEVSLVFSGPDRGPGCMNFIGIWQHA